MPFLFKELAKLVLSPLRLLLWLFILFFLPSFVSSGERLKNGSKLHFNGTAFHVEGASPSIPPVELTLQSHIVLHHRYSGTVQVQRVETKVVWERLQAKDVKFVAMIY